MAVLAETELIVCDNNSSDRTAEIARAAGATVVFEPVNQIARARNTGARVATGDWLVFIDADSSPSIDLFSEVKRVMEAGEAVAGGVTVAFDRIPLEGRIAIAGWNALSRAARWMAGSFIFVRADAFRAVGGFNEELYASEEIDLSRKLKRRGRVVILHRHPLRTSARKLQLYSRAELRRFMWRMLLTRGQALRRKDECSPWYDGRR
jgi:glycosyltransferase involved in cell wall biosynthesis